MIRYCPESKAIFDGEIDLTKCGHYTFNFSQRGLFTLLNRKGEPLYETTLPLFNKVCSHLLWIFLWIFIIALTNFFGPTTYLRITNPITRYTNRAPTQARAITHSGQLLNAQLMQTIF